MLNPRELYPYISDEHFPIVVEAVAKLYPYPETIPNPEYDPKDEKSPRDIPNPMTPEMYLVNRTSLWLSEVMCAYLKQGELKLPPGLNTLADVTAHVEKEVCSMQEEAKANLEKAMA